MNKDATKKDLRQFGIALSVILGVFGTIHFFKGHGSAYPWFFALAIVFLFLGILIPKSLKQVFTIFTKIAHAIGWFNTRVILIVVYYIILTPIGLVMKMFGKDILDIKSKQNKETYWRERKTIKTDANQLTKQF